MINYAKGDANPPMFNDLLETSSRVDWFHGPTLCFSIGTSPLKSRLMLRVGGVDTVANREKGSNVTFKSVPGLLTDHSL